MTSDSRLFRDSRTVQLWRESAGLDDADPRVETLAAFCASVEVAPDELVETCLRAVDGGQFKIRTAARRKVSDQIETFQQGNQTRGNIVRSFLIHNGVSLQPPTILK